MQNIPGINLENAKEQLKTVSFSQVKKTDQQMLFADLFDQHSTRIESELALKPVSTKEQMLEVAPETADEAKQEAVNAANNKAPVANENEVAEEEVDYERDRDQRMTQEDFDEVKDDLKEYGLSEEEITEIEEEINSEEGMTWGQFVSTIANKMAEMRKISLNDGQKEQLSTFFAKFGFTAKESDKLIKQLENGNQGEVMAALKKKIDNMPEGQQLLFTKDEMEAFSAAMNFSKEFTSKIKEAFGSNMLPKDVKQAFTMIRQEMASMDEKDQNLVRAVGKQFVQAVGKEAKESTLAKEVNEVVDLKARVAEEKPQSEVKEQVKEDFKEALDTRKETLPSANNTRKTEQKVMPEQAEADVSDQGNTESDNHWNNFFNKLQPKGEQSTGTQFQAKTENIESMLKTGLAEAKTDTSTKAWEKVSAPKVMRQVENAFIQNLQNGGKQLTLQLTPENLGKLSVLLQVQGKEVSATIRAENADAARIIADNIDIIKSSLENQGLKVDKLEVQTGLSNDLPQNDWFGKDEHNMAREREAMVAMRKHMKHMREGDAQLAQDLQSNTRQATVADQGLHIIA